MPDGAPTLIYLDTNVYTRPFDDQTQSDIQEEANAFVEIIADVEAKRFSLISSDILRFEVFNILGEEKGAKVKDYLAMCNRMVESSEEVLVLGKRVQSDCHIRARDALHIASAIIGQARYFLSCDQKVTMMKQARCYRRLAKPYRTNYFSAMNPTLFLDKMKKGEVE
jgi:predicted nucleic acid-binding protein